MIPHTLTRRKVREKIWGQKALKITIKPEISAQILTNR